MTILVPTVGEIVQCVAGWCLYDDWLVVIDIFQIGRWTADRLGRHAVSQEDDEYGDRQEEYGDSNDLDFACVVPHGAEEVVHRLVS